LLCERGGLDAPIIRSKFTPLTTRLFLPTTFFDTDEKRFTKDSSNSIFPGLTRGKEEEAFIMARFQHVV
jgi:hypothetical protein